jgi:hypothetical protein
MVGAFLASPVGSWLRVFVFGALTLFLSAQALDADSFATNWRVYVIGGILAAGPVIIAYFNPADPRFGNTAAPK